MNDDALFSNVIYPIIFDKKPIHSLSRVVQILYKDLNNDERARLILLLSSGIYGATHRIVDLIEPICDRKELESYLVALLAELQK